MDTKAKTPVRKTRTFKHEGKEISMAELSRATKIGYTTLYARIIEQEMTVEDAIKGPKGKTAKPAAKKTAPTPKPAASKS